MSARFYIIEGRQLTFESLTREQADEVKAFLVDDIIKRKQDELIAYYSMHVLEDDLDDCSPLVREFLSKKIKENGGSVNIQLGM